MILRLYRFLYRQSSIKLITLGILLPLFVNVFVILAEDFLFDEISNKSDYRVTFVTFVLMVLFAPMMETLLFQYLPLKISGAIFEDNRYSICAAILIASLIFGLMHGIPADSTAYSIIAFSYGVIWSTCCLLFIRKRKHPILFTAIIHACYNGLLFSVMYLAEDYDKM